ncbi:hypothetical protein PG994_001550 [Apiospora phragmitis]|uniref:YAG7-like dimerisation domain-containing protein n=1 Tax=Apiospora phragmitis TaxID=2905665 RepID=A0ABR1WTV0_9PEZI
MPSSAVQNPVGPTESKSAKKKKAAAAAQRTDSPAPSPSAPISVSGDDANESPYVRELQKNIRNINKKILILVSKSNVTKTHALIEQHKDKSLEEMVAAKIINADQKSQVLKKPQLESQLAQVEEQLAQYKKVDEEYRTKSAADKAKVEKDLTERLEKEKADALVAATEKAAADIKKVQHDSLLVLTQFLRLAAARRSEDADATADENMALEGVLLNVYSGDENAVATMMKLIEGSEEKTRSVSGDELQTSFAQVKAASAAHVQVFAAAEDPVPEATEATADAPVSDPTVTHAGLTEIEDTETSAPLANGHNEPIPMPASEDWVKVPRDPTETDTGLTATPAASGPVQSWADDQPENPPETTAAQADDGFQSVQRNRPRGQGEGGEHRGGRRGGRGDYRGRGRGEGGRGRGRYNDRRGGGKPSS